MGNLSERLGMGHYTLLTQAIRRAESRPGGKLKQIKSKLLRLWKTQAG